MKLTILGSGTCIYHTFKEGRKPTNFFLETEGGNYLIDAGGGIMATLVENGINPNIIDAVLISHEHGDHSAGLVELIHGMCVHPWLHPNLPELREKGKSLPFVGFKTLKKFVDIAAEWAWHQPEHLPLEVHELGHEDAWEDDNIKLTAYHVPHTDTSLGFRIEADGKVLGYTGDSMNDPVLENVLHDADLAICNVATPPGGDDEHLDPRSLSQRAAKASAKKLLFVHGYPELMDRADEMEGWVREFFDGPWEFGKDGETLDI